ncbi:MAG: hypothetical protein LBL96_09155 [Clostridiales bacterium]|jgi:sialate O-acetylesterase|nr:hypothetical protein [Clostridiales bacterium]
MPLELPALVASGMVIQRDEPVTIWGKCDESVRLAFRGETYDATPDDNNEWSVQLNRQSVGGPFEMTINDVTLTEVYVGDVWLASGQSNMQMNMERCKYMYPEEMREVNPDIRQFLALPRYDYSTERTDPQGEWKGVKPDTIGEFSAVAYFFAKRLQSKYYTPIGGKIPIGIILCAVGGTRVHAWMSKGSLADFPDLIAEADEYADMERVWDIIDHDNNESQKFFNMINEMDQGLAEQWYEPEYDDSEWESRDLLTPWEGTRSVWMRKTVDIPEDWDGKQATLFFGSVKDWDMAYVNGEFVGNTTYRWPPREYEIPKLQAGRCVITLRIISIEKGWCTPGKPYMLRTSSSAILLDGEWRFKAGDEVSPLEPATNFNYIATGLYNGMLKPLTRYRIKGAIWYQGESDALDPECYSGRFGKLVEQWRADWGYDFPFVFTELVHWEEENWDAVRKEQRNCLKLPNVAMVSADALGEYNDLHPINKQPIGDRLARCAMRIAYGDTMPISPFEIVAAKWK